MKNFLMLMLFLGTLTKSSDSIANSNMKKLNICLPQKREELVILQMLLAKEKALFEKNGIQANFIVKPFNGFVKQNNYPNSAKDLKISMNYKFQNIGINSFKEEDKCDIVTTSIETLFFDPKSMDKFAPLQLVAYGDTYDTHLVVNKDSKYNSLNDLKGKKIRVGFIATVIALEEMLKREGLDLKNVEVVQNMLPTEINQALASNKIDAAISYFPTMHALLTSGKVRILKKDIYSNYLNSPSPKSVTFVRKDLKAKDPEVVNAFRKTLLEVQKFGNENPSQLAMVLKNNAKLLDMPQWEISNAEIEKINEIYTNVLSVNFEGEKLNFKGKEMDAFDVLDRYNQKLVDLHFVKEKVDFSKWKQK